jgi:NAD(P)-dependent dehydrogenase (short-subunit alcohol dehydrogenase family)
MGPADCRYWPPGQVFYDLSKVAVTRLGYSLGHELQRFGATAVAVTPGWLRSETMFDNWAVTEDNWHRRDGRRCEPCPLEPALHHLR